MCFKNDGFENELHLQYMITAHSVGQVQQLMCLKNDGFESKSYIYITIAIRWDKFNN